MGAALIVAGMETGEIRANETHSPKTRYAEDSGMAPQAQEASASHNQKACFQS